eukprot:TRINITY_DN3859_c0_g1_i1.p1 TRINITY_DN3859_c0_g1~~TRINITY_DN3859_c0_g1_i1.p1  ORF type:complete len:269 (-),score=99.27 TRINITY_DN3859_c0_g1_i1:124-930(-)
MCIRDRYQRRVHGDKIKRTMASKKTQIQVEKKAAPENVQLKEKRDARLRTELLARRAERKKTALEKKKQYLSRAETHHKEYLATERKAIDERRQARANGSFFVQEEPRVFLVIRIRGISNLSPTVRKILQLLRLRQLHNATLIRVNKATINMLRRVEPFVAYGFPSRQLISDLIYKRGYVRVNKQRTPISRNEIIEAHLGKHGIICVEDLIHELVTCGPHFKEANNFLWPFKLTSPRKGFAAKRHPYHNRGAWGNREHRITELARRML